MNNKTVINNLRQIDFELKKALRHTQCFLSKGFLGKIQNSTVSKYFAQKMLLKSIRIKMLTGPGK